jgi:hypothetical protein
MGNEMKYGAVTADRKKRIGVSQAVVECKLKVKEDEKIDKVLSVSCTGAVNGFEAVSGEVRFNGAVGFKILYGSEAGKIYCLDYQADFNDLIEEKSITPHDRLTFDCNIMDTDTVAATSDEITVAAVIEVYCDKFVCSEIKFVESGEGIYTQKEAIDYGKIASADLEFTVGEEYEAKENISKIYLAEASAIVNDCAAGTDSLTVSGEIITTVTYNNSFESDKMRSLCVVTPFREEIAAAGARPEHGAAADVCVKNLKITCDTSEENPSNVFKLDLSIGVKSLCFEKQNCEVVVDAFSITNDIKIAGESFDTEIYCGLNCYREKIEGSVNLGADMPRINEIVAISASRINIANTVAGEDEAVIEGLINTAVIYTNYDSEIKNSVAAELPFSLTLKTDGIKENMRIETSAIIFDIFAKNRKNNEIEITAEIKLSVNVYKPVSAYVISEVAMGTEKALGCGAIGIYIARPEETLWDISKVLLVSPEEIMQQNPQLTIPLTGNEKIMVYRQMKAALN